MPDLHVLRVFCGANGAHGNPLGVFLEGAAVPAKLRQSVARDLGFSETVFVDDRAAATVRIYTPAIELPFAGHPMVGTAWLLAREGSAPSFLRAPAGELPVRLEADGAGGAPPAWIAARPEWCPHFEYIELESPAAVDALNRPPGNFGFAYCWAWVDESRGVVRARSFVADAGIPEDEATGAAALALCARLGRPLTVLQGHGSEIAARPLGDGFTEIGGRVVLDEVREYAIPVRA